MIDKALYGVYWMDKWSDDSGDYDKAREESIKGRLSRRLFQGGYDRLRAVHQAFIEEYGIPEKICHFVSHIERCHYMVSQTADGLVFVYVEGGDDGCMYVYPRNQAEWLNIRDAMVSKGVIRLPQPRNPALA